MDSRSIFRRPSLDAEFQHAIVRCSWVAANETPLSVSHCIRSHRSCSSISTSSTSLRRRKVDQAMKLQTNDVRVQRRGTLEIDPHIYELLAQVSF